MHLRNRYAAAFAAICLGLLIIHFAGVAQSQQNAVIVLDKQQVTFSGVPASSTQTQTVNVTASSATTIVIDMTNAPSWLQVTPSGNLNVAAGSPTPLTVRAVSAGPPALGPGTYAGSFTVAVQGSSSTPMRVFVNL